MKRSWALVAITFLSLMALCGCMTKTVVLDVDNVLDSSEHLGNIRFVDDKGLIYIAQAVEETDEGDTYRLLMAEVIDDGVRSNEMEVILAKKSIVSATYHENNKWVVGGMVTGTSVFLFWLYYKINTDVFD
jgi:hypothetical protein